MRWTTGKIDPWSPASLQKYFVFIPGPKFGQSIFYGQYLEARKIVFEVTRLLLAKATDFFQVFEYFFDSEPLAVTFDNLFRRQIEIGRNERFQWSDLFNNRSIGTFFRLDNSADDHSNWFSIRELRRFAYDDFLQDFLP